MPTTTIRHKGAFTVERSALGQVAEYDVYEEIDGEKIFKGGGTKYEALRIFRKLSGKS